MAISSDEFSKLNQLSDLEIEGYLLSGEYESQLREFFGSVQYDELRDLARQPEHFAGPGLDIVLLPGIMGSELEDVEGNHGKVWVDKLSILASGSFGLLKLAIDGAEHTKGIRLSATGLLKTAYFKPKRWLESCGHNVYSFPYDWRRPIDNSAKILKAFVDQIVQNDPKRRVVLLAHSMGGLVARRYLDLFGQEALDRLDRLIMMGTPNHGSYVPLMAMKGKYTILRVVSFIYGGEIARAVVQSFPGLYEMFPHTSIFGQPDLYDQGYWQDPAMPQSHLDGARSFQERIQARLPGRMILIACRNRKTVTQMQREPDGASWRYRFLGARVGDGTVPFDSAYLSDVPTYETDAEHGEIQKDNNVLRAVDELLQDGRVKSLYPYVRTFASEDEPDQELEEIEPIAPLLQL